MKRYILLLLPLGALVCSCAGLGRALTDMSGAGVGAALGHLASHGNSGWTAGGAVLGVGAAELFGHYKGQAMGKAIQSGYDKGRSDSAKDQFWIQQNFERRTLGTSDAPITLYPLPIPEQEIDGVRLQPTTRILRIHQ